MNPATAPASCALTSPKLVWSDCRCYMHLESQTLGLQGMILLQCASFGGKTPPKSYFGFMQKQLSFPSKPGELCFVRVSSA